MGRKVFTFMIEAECTLFVAVEAESKEEALNWAKEMQWDDAEVNSVDTINDIRHLDYEEDMGDE